MTTKKHQIQTTDDPSQLYYGEVELDRNRRLRFDVGSWIQFKKLTGINVLSVAFSRWIDGLLVATDDEGVPLSFAEATKRKEAGGNFSMEVDIEKLVTFLYVSLLHDDTDGYKREPSITPQSLYQYITPQTAYALATAVLFAKRETDPEPEGKQERPLGEGADGEPVTK